ncbi:MAG: baseplate J/gp47 family protein [Candidatus Binataceae bacterium]
MGAGISNLPPPTFVNDADGLNPNLILADMVAAFQAAAGRTLQPAQVERLLINLYAYRESLVRNAIQYAGQQNLLAFAVFPMIDYLGQLLGVSRLGAQGAVTTLQFTLQNALTLPYTIPAGTQGGTADGEFVFATNADLIVPAATTVASVTATCTTAGPNANGYLPGQINVLLNPNVLIASVTNTITTGGGSAPETDDHLRTRIQAAPNQFSVAGPAGAYRFFALGVDPSIIDVSVASPTPGTVQIYILTGPIATQPAASPNNAGVANSALLAKVLQALSADNVRPLTDTVSALAVSEIDYQIAGTVTLFADAEPISTMAAVNAAAQDIALNLAARIQRDIVPSEIVAALSVPGVYQVVLTQPSYTQLSVGQWANCTAITLAQATAAESS